MNVTPENAAIILGQLRKIIDSGEPETHKLNVVWHSLMFYRGEILAALLQRTIGDRVYGGPFKGMRLTSAIMQGTYAPELLGVYEYELHGVVDEIMRRPYRLLLNIGCAFGYYATGFAQKMPQLTVEAFDTDPAARAKCAELASLNGVGERVKIGAEFMIGDFARYAGEKCLLLMDIEGAEKTLLDPVAAPALRGMDILVELHDCNERGLSQLVAARFKDSHRVEIIPNRAAVFDFTPITGPDTYISPLDALAATWEKRAGPTPWGWFQAK